MKIGQVAAQAGVNIDTLRYYERRGLLTEPQRRPSGYREYPPETVRIVRFIKRAQALGFSLDEIEELLRLRGGQAPRAEVRRIAEARIKDVDERLAQLQAVRSALHGLLESCACSRARPTCPILDALDAHGEQPPAARRKRDARN